VLLAVLLVGTGDAHSVDDCDTVDWPLSSVSCAQYQRSGSRMERADDAGSRISMEQAAEAAQQERPGSEVIEARLVRVFSESTMDARSTARVVWAVSMTLPDGPGLSGGAFIEEELRRIRSDGDTTRAMSPEESAAVREAVTRRVNELRAAATETYRIEFIDPETGQWLGGAEGAATP